MKHYPDFTPEMDQHCYLTNAVIYYAYWLTADLDSYIEKISNDEDLEGIADGRVIIVDNRYGLILRVVNNAKNLFDKKHMEDEGFSNHSINFLEESMKYVEDFVSKSNPSRRFKILRSSDIEETDMQNQLHDEIGLIEKIGKVGNELHPDCYLDNAISKFEQLLALMSEEKSEMPGTQFFTSRYSKLSSEFHLSKASFLSFGKGAACTNELHKIAGSMFDDARLKENYLHRAAILYGSWENLFQLGEMLIKQFVHPIDGEDLDEINKEFQEIYDCLLLAEFRYYESVMQSAKKFAVKNTPLVKSGLPSINLSNCIKGWQKAYQVEQTG